MYFFCKTRLDKLEIRTFDFRSVKVCVKFQSVRSTEPEVHLFRRGGVSAVPIICTRLKTRSSWLHASDSLTHSQRHSLHDMQRHKYESEKVIQRPPVLVVVAFLCASTIDHAILLRKRI